MTTSFQFYRDLPGFSQFADLYMSKHFRRVPDDWFIVICDLRDSTKAIGAGRYQDVNLIAREDEARDAGGRVDRHRDRS